jgi:hypothetical protein
MRSRRTMHFVTSFGIGTPRMAQSSCSVCAPWAFATGPIAPRSPWQNANVERRIGSIRRECLDHMIEAHLRRILGSYAACYNESRIHRSLNKDAPFHRAIERLGAITSQSVLGGLHHKYRRI